MRKKSILSAFLVLVGIVLGTLVANVTKGIPALAWLAWSMPFGFEEPVVLNLSVIRLTFGLNVDLSVAVILLVLISIIVGRFIDRS